jgi:DNA-binding Lrp family transcriptional regulator
MQKMLGKVVEKMAAAVRAALWPLFQRRGYSEFARSHGGQQKVTLFAKVIVRPRTAGQFSLFEAAVQDVAEVVSAHRLAGSDDYLLEIKQDYPVQLDQLKAQVLAPLPGFVDCSIAVVARTAVDPDAFSEAVGISDAHPRWSASPRAAFPV